MKLYFYTFLIAIISCTTKQNSDSIKSSQVILNKDVEGIDSTEEDKNTYLKGGFSIIYSVDKEKGEQILVYKKGTKIIDTISDGGIDLSILNIGFVIADFDDTFVFLHAFGSGNPCPIELYDKETSKKLIKDFSYFIDVDTTKQILLYSEKDVPTAKDKMTLFDVEKRTKKEYKFPKEVFGDHEILNRIHLLNISEKTFTIEVDYFNNRKPSKQKKYIR